MRPFEVVEYRMPDCVVVGSRLLYAPNLEGAIEHVKNEGNGESRVGRSGRVLVGSDVAFVFTPLPSLA